MIKILLIGSGGREHAIAKAIARSPQAYQLYCFASHANPAIMALSHDYLIANLAELDAIIHYAKHQNIDFAIVGPEAPLALGIVDRLAEQDIPAIGPTQELAQIETSKGFARNLLQEYNIPGGPQYKNFKSLDGVKDMLQTLGEDYVIKADGLMGGKGVQVAGDHLHSHDEALSYCQELTAQKQRFVIEEKFYGEEFSLLSFTDGYHSMHMPTIKDHKRAFEDDQGPNTGGMGCYSCANHRLPFLTAEDIAAAAAINEACIEALKNKFSHAYKGILYGGFMKTAQGVRLIEYNARFGDPEAISLLELLETDFIAICQAIINDTLDKVDIVFSQQATVCKYIVPKGYPNNPVKQEIINISDVTNPEQLFFASVSKEQENIVLLGSRAIAVLGKGHDLATAEQQAQIQIEKISGPIFYRRDIGTSELLNKQVKQVTDTQKS